MEDMNQPTEGGQDVATPDSGHDTGTDNSIGASLDRAFAAVDRGDDNYAPPQPDDMGSDPEGKSDRARGPDGRFVAQEGEQPAQNEGQEQQAQLGIAEPPSRFSPDAKAAWAQAPEAVRGEINRAIGELENGINHYRERFAPLEQYEQMAQQSGKRLDAVLGEYVGMENLLRTDPVQGLEVILDRIGITPQQYAQHILGHPADEAGQAQQGQMSPVYEKIIHDLQSELHAIKQQQSGMMQTVEKQQMAHFYQAYAEFEKSHPRAGELWDSMSKIMEAGLADTPETAYQMAERLKPGAAPVQQTPAATAATQPAAAQTRKGNLSVSGAPSSGSNPANRKPPSSPGEAVERAFAQLGIA